MTDYFALLDEPRRPWLETEALKEKFLARSAALHPDRVHDKTAEEQRAANQRFTELNAAFQCLREDHSRLRHLLELETGHKPVDVQRVPEDVMQLFLAVSQLCRAVDAFVAERAQVSSPLLKVKFLTRTREWAEQIAALQQQLAARQNALREELKALNSSWASAPPVDEPARARVLPLPRLGLLYQLASYLHRWAGQLAERQAQLSF
jgi:DnaJ-domain-containing protein 1